MFPMPRGPYTKVGWARMRKRFESTFFLNQFIKYEGKGSKVARELEHYWMEAGKRDGGKAANWEEILRSISHERKMEPKNDTTEERNG